MPPGLGATRAHRYAPTFGSPALPDINYAAPPPTQRSAGYNTRVAPWAATRSVNAAEAARSTYSDPYARQQSQGHLPKPCSLGDLLTGLFAPSSNGSLLHELAGFGLHAMQNGSLASDLGDWLGYNLATSYYQFEQWLANPANFQLALGILVITTAIVVTGGAAIPVILMGAAIGAGIGYGAQVFQNYQQGYSHLDALWNQINLAGIGQAAFHGAVSGAAAAAFLPGGGAGLAGALQTGLAEFVSGRVAQIALNMVSGQAWNQDLWNPLDIALDVLPGVGGSLFDTWRVGRATAQASNLSILDNAVDNGVKQLDEIGSPGKTASSSNLVDASGHPKVENYLDEAMNNDNPPLPNQGTKPDYFGPREGFPNTMLDTDKRDRALVDMQKSGESERFTTIAERAKAMYTRVEKMGSPYEGIDYAPTLRELIKQRKLKAGVNYLYAIDLQGNIRLGHPKTMDIDHHSFLVKGENVYGAGHIQFRYNDQGKLVVEFVTPATGHYSGEGQEARKEFGKQFRPYLEHLLTVYHRFEVERWGSWRYRF